MCVLPVYRIPKPNIPDPDVCVLPVYRITKLNIPDPDMCVFYLYIEYLSQIFLILICFCFTCI